jgi:hypothetical protein
LEGGERVSGESPREEFNFVLFFVLENVEKSVKSGWQGVLRP